MPPAPAISPSTKRKKWTEEEESSLIDKYAEMQSDGTLARLRTREKKFRPIAAHVNAVHHAMDSVTYPFIWSWKNTSTKVQNMRHQYLLVKQKLISSSPGEIDLSQGINLWPNFLRYRDVFGDVDLPVKKLDFDSSVAVVDGDFGLGLGLGFEGSDEDGGFDYVEDVQVAPVEVRKKRRRGRREGGKWARVSIAVAEIEERVRRVREEEEREMEMRERRREEEEREWEGRMARRRGEWRKRMEGMMVRHKAEMEEMRARMMHEQRTVVEQLVGVISHWTGGSGIGEVAEMGGGSGVGGQHYVSQMMHGMVHVNGMEPGENGVDGDGGDGQFIVDD